MLCRPFLMLRTIDGRDATVSCPQVLNEIVETGRALGSRTKSTRPSMRLWARRRLGPIAFRYGAHRIQVSRGERYLAPFDKKSENLLQGRA
jgi:hypothetical protein